MTLLLLSCSKEKAAASCAAVDMYRGPLFSSGRSYAESRGLEIKILSAKYGFLDPQTIIDPYDEKMQETYAGPWPAGDGFYFGGSLYFRNAPPCFQPLVPFGTQGKMVSMLGCLDTISREELFLRKRVRGVVQAIFDICTTRKITKDALIEELYLEFGSRRSQLRITVNCQLRQTRMGKERNCTVHFEDGCFYLTKN